MHNLTIVIQTSVCVYWIGMRYQHSNWLNTNTNSLSRL